MKEALSKIKAGGRILDAGAGSQQYKKDCMHLNYSAQDFGKVTVDENKGFAALPAEYQYGPLDYVCDITSIPVEAASMDAVLCTEVFEHIPDPVAALREFSRLLKDDGILVLTVPSNCLRHFDPYFFFSGFSDRWLQHWLKETGFAIVKLEVDGNYFKWLAIELGRIGRTNWLAIPFLIPAFGWLYFKSKKASPEAIATLCGGYYVVAQKNPLSANL